MDRTAAGHPGDQDGAADSAPPPGPLRRILVVCTANQCRSPMAEGLLRQRLAVAGLGGRVLVSSAGTWARAGAPATDKAVATLAERGIALHGHRSREVDGALLADADLILVMTRGHAEALVAEFPQAGARLLRFAQLAGGSWDIADPVGQGMDAYRATAAELDLLLEAGWAMLLERLELQQP